MPTPRSRLGKSAEIAAAAELGRRGYRIIASNYSCRAGEIDLIAEHDDSLVFVEVRCKRSNAFGTPAESVTPAKQHKLIATAEHYLEANNLWDRACRFDVVEVLVINDKLTVSDILQNAFTS